MFEWDPTPMPRTLLDYPASGWPLNDWILVEATLSRAAVVSNMISGRANFLYYNFLSPLHQTPPASFPLLSFEVRRLGRSRFAEQPSLEIACIGSSSYLEWNREAITSIGAVSCYTLGKGNPKNSSSATKEFNVRLPASCHCYCNYCD